MGGDSICFRKMRSKIMSLLLLCGLCLIAQARPREDRSDEDRKLREDRSDEDRVWGADRSEEDRKLREDRSEEDRVWGADRSEEDRKLEKSKICRACRKAGYKDITIDGLKCNSLRNVCLSYFMWGF